ncbi:DUF6902 family protein [Pseudooceanicola algae]|uniref:Uncharacterized protein n=1 Tax=Pseudooceanicola algae TaxID=1537215 RepID=A0A418SE10_9RHOB|nr:hypothetical protein [Pseudooceanicola algae]QPM89449.1 hypothetical protein PSAL_006680 [Pseudooceanicola algae]
MSNVIPFTLSRRHAPTPLPRQGDRAGRQAALIALFAQKRRGQGDVFWLKENAELLNILESTGAGRRRAGIPAAPLPDGALSPHQALYDRIEERLRFFPQYYRFFLSICLDLEDLGFGGSKGEALVQQALRVGLADAELSDLQRAEARRLMQRRGRDPIADSTGLTARLLAFAGRSATFAVPNKKAAYELTHICFYLSDYGRLQTDFPRAVQKSLNFAGTLAYLDANADLLAEICVALRQAGQTPPQAWESWLAVETARFQLLDSGNGGGAAGGVMAQDGYHEFLVSNWALGVSGDDAFAHDVPEGRVQFRTPRRAASPLLAMSRHLLEDERRSGDWEVMRGPLAETLWQAEPQALDLLADAEAACEDFPAFFETFARAGSAAIGTRAHLHGVPL